MKYIGIIVSLLIVISLPSTGISETLKFCGVHWPPFIYAEDEHIVKGISFDIYTEAFRRLNREFDAEEIPWPRCVEYVQEGDYDAILDAGTPRPSIILGKQPTSIFPLAIFVREEFPEDHFSRDALKGKTVGVIRGYDYGDRVPLTDWKLDFSKDEEMLLKKLQGGRHDYVLLDIFVAPVLAEKLGIKVKMLSPLVDAYPLSLGFSAKHESLVQEYDRVIEVMIQDGTLDKIYQTYLPYNYHTLLTMFEEMEKSFDQ